MPDTTATEERLVQHLRRMGAELDAATARVADLEDRLHEPIAVVGMGCRYPGGVDSPEALWRVVTDQVDAVGPLPTDRGWDLERLADPDGGSTSRAGGFVDGVDRFDADFFGVSPREAAAMDPQQRLLLETSWEALERAGIDPLSTRDTQVGVFIGSNIQDYGDVLAAAGSAATGYHVTGATGAVVAGRIAYALGLRGPAETVDTACSSSLVALHLATQALRNRECTTALAGGATVLSTDRGFTEFSAQGALAPDGRCKAFGAGAGGFGLAEGAGVLVLERLSEARRRGRTVLAVLRGSAVNSDGASNGITAPSGPAQERVLRDALSAAGVSAADVDLVEAHGTGTRLGDPIEANALIAVYGAGRLAGRPLRIGSVKSNLGHTQAASGVAGVIKVVQALRHRVLPPTLHAGTPTPEVDWSAGTVVPLTEALPWDATGPRRAAVSSFGISGTNAHVVVEEASAAEPAAPVVDPQTTAWPLSARTATALRAQAAGLAAWLDEHPDTDPGDVARVLITGRADLAHRAVVLGDDLAGLRAGLAEPTTSGVVDEPGRVAFAFSGQGSQRAGMGAELRAAFPAYAAAFDAVCAEFAELLDHPLADVILARPGDPLHGLLDRTGYAQPALFAVQVAQVALLRSWGVEPDRVVGHSIGELTAAHVAGVLSLSDACALVAARGELMDAEPEGGAMAALELDEAAALALIGDRAAIAAINAPRSVVVSGTADVVAEVVAEVRAAGGRATPLQVSHAFHSPLMEPVRDRLCKVAAELTFHRPAIPIVSAVDGEVISAERLADPDHWADHVLLPVRFHDAVRTLVEREGVDAVVEVGPDGGLTGAITQAAGTALCVPTARRDRPAVRTALTALAALHCHGVPVDWAAVHPGRGTLLDLPTYPFERQRHWLAAARRPAGELYAESWQPIPGGQPPTGPWLLLTDENGTDGGVAALLADQGMTVVPVPVDLAGGRSAIATALAAAPSADGVLSTLALDEANALTATLAALQGLGDLGHPIPLWTITRGSVDTLPSPAAAEVWGLGRVAALEVPERWGGLVDLPGTTDAATGGLLSAALNCGDDQIAVRDGLLGRRVVPTAPGTGTAPELSGTVLVTGGLGALGAHVARDLARRGAHRLVLVGRRGAETPGADDLRGELTGLGAEVAIAAVDVADRGALAALLDGIPDLCAVVHAAGLLDDGVLDDLTPDRVAAVLAAKAESARHLDELTRDRELSAFILFSSLSGVLGNAGQAGYAAANARLDALARTRRALGMPATAVAWGPWAGSGMAEGAEERLRAAGLRPLPPARALDLLWRAVTAAEPAVLAADVDWDRYAAARPGPQLSALADLPAPQTAEPVAAELAVLNGPELHARLLDLVGAQVAVTLGLGARKPGPRQAFQEIGFDSLTAVELRNRLQAAVGVDLPATLVFDHPNPTELAEFLRGLLEGGPAGPERLLADLDRLDTAYAAADLDHASRSAVRARLRELLRTWDGDEQYPATAAPLADASASEVIDFITGQLGIAPHPSADGGIR